MGLLSWIVMGFLAGGFARVATGSEKRGCIGTIVVGIIGALVGGLLFNAVTGYQVTEFNLVSLGISFVGASLFLLVLQAIGGRRRPD